MTLAASGGIGSIRVSFLRGGSAGGSGGRDGSGGRGGFALGGRGGFVSGGRAGLGNVIGPSRLGRASPIDERETGRESFHASTFGRNGGGSDANVGGSAGSGAVRVSGLRGPRIAPCIIGTPYLSFDHTTPTTGSPCVSDSKRFLIDA